MIKSISILSFLRLIVFQRWRRFNFVANFSSPTKFEVLIRTWRLVALQLGNLRCEAKAFVRWEFKSTSKHIAWKLQPKFIGKINKQMSCKSHQVLLRPEEAICAQKRPFALLWISHSSLSGSNGCYCLENSVWMNWSFEISLQFEMYSQHDRAMRNGCFGSAGEIIITFLSLFWWKPWNEIRDCGGKQVKPGTFLTPKLQVFSPACRVCGCNSYELHQRDTTLLAANRNMLSFPAPAPHCYIFFVFYRSFCDISNSALYFCQTVANWTFSIISDVALNFWEWAVAANVTA